MHGNVGEFCQDSYDDYRKEDVTDPLCEWGRGLSIVAVALTVWHPHAILPIDSTSLAPTRKGQPNVKMASGVVWFFVWSDLRAGGRPAVAPSLTLEVDSPWPSTRGKLKATMPGRRPAAKSVTAGSAEHKRSFARRGVDLQRFGVERFE